MVRSRAAASVASVLALWLGGCAVNDRGTGRGDDGVDAAPTAPAPATADARPQPGQDGPAPSQPPRDGGGVAPIAPDAPLSDDTRPRPDAAAPVMDAPFGVDRPPPDAAMPPPLPPDAAPPPDTRPPAPPVVISFQRGVAPTAAYFGERDTTISQHDPERMFPSLAAASVDGDDPPGSGDDLYGLFLWDLTAIPTNATIVKVEMTLQIVDSSADMYPFYELKRAWTPETVSWRAANGQPWQVPGARGEMDRGTAVLGVLGPATAGQPTTVVFTPAGVEAVQRWVREPSTNHGYVIANPDATDGLDYRTVDNGTLTLRPRLTVTYTLP